MEHIVMKGNFYDVMQDRECIVFERTHDTEQRIHEPCACLWVPCSSCLQLIITWIYLQLTRMAVHLTAGIFCRLPLGKIITPQNFLCLWRKIIQKASADQIKVCMMNVCQLKYDFLRILSLFIRPLNCTQNDMCATSEKNTNFNIWNILLCKVGISNSLCGRTV